MFFMIALLSLGFGVSFKDKDTGFEIQFPTGWQIVDEHPSAMVLGGLPGEASVIVVHLDSNTYFDSSFADPFLRGIRNQLAEVEVHEQKQAEWMGEPAIRISYEGKSGPIRLRFLTFYLGKAGAYFLITCSAKGQAFEELAWVFDQILASIRIQDPPGYEHTLALYRVLRVQPLDQLAMQAALDKGADPNGIVKGYSLLTHAVRARAGLAVKWLLDRGAQVRHPANDYGMLIVIATPPILKLLDQHMSAHPKTPSVWNEANPSLEISWASPEAQLLGGIEAGNMDDVKGGWAKGADLTVLHDQYQLPPLAFTRKLIEEMTALDLDTASLIEIEAFLADAKQQGKPASVEESDFLHLGDYPGRGPTKAGVYELGRTGLQAPRPQLKIPATYPKKAKTLKLMGWVALAVTIDEEGKPTDIEVLRGLGKNRFGFEEAAVAALEKWRFEPGRLQDQPVPVRLAIKLSFDASDAP